MAKKYKGVQYIGQKLRKYYPKRYGSYNEALPDARMVFAQIQDAKERVTVKNILSKVRVQRRKIKGAPELPLEMTEPINYFNMQVYIELISKLPDNIMFRSKLIPAAVKQPIVGGGFYTYESLFKPYVDYINTIKALTPEEDDRYESDWYVRCTMPEPDKKKKGIWNSTIISCDSRGDEFDYGFDPKAPTKEATQAVLSGTEPVPEVKEQPPIAETEKQTPVAPTDDRAFLMEMEKQKERTATATASAARAKMEYITMLKELGYTPAEIKAELNKL